MVVPICVFQRTSPLASTSSRQVTHLVADFFVCCMSNPNENSKLDDETARYERRRALRELNATTSRTSTQSQRMMSSPHALPYSEPGNSLDSSLKRHTALIKRMKLSMGAENRDQIIRDLDTLTLEKYIEEIVSASAEGCLRCKTDKDTWAAVEVRKIID